MWGGAIIIAWNYNAAKEWGALGSQVLTPSDISYKLLINSRTVHGERTRAVAWKVGEAASGETDSER